MKKYLSILLILLSACNGLKEAGSITPKDQINRYIKLKRFQSDTLAYVKHNFIAQKKKYIGNELNTLLKDLEIPIKSYVDGRDIKDNNKVTHLYLQFHSIKQERSLYYYGKKPVGIIVHFFQPLPADSVNFLWNKDYGAWSKDTEIYFGKQKISSVATTIFEK